MDRSLAGLSIDRLITFCMVVEKGSIKAAAKGDPNKQSQFSRQIKELEDLLQLSLFDRRGKALVLTDAGRRLAVLSQAFFEEIAVLRDTRGGASQIVVGAAESVVRWILLPRLDALISANPRVRFEFRNLRTGMLAEEIANGSVHIGIIRKDAIPSGALALPVGRMDFVFAVPRSLLPQGRAEDLERMLTLPFGMLRGDGSLHRGIEELARTHQIRLRTVFTAESFSLLLDSAAKGRFATVIPRQASTGLDENEWVVMSQGLEPLSRELALIYDSNVAAMRSIVSRTASRMIEVLMGT